VIKPPLRLVLSGSRPVLQRQPSTGSPEVIQRQAIAAPRAPRPDLLPPAMRRSATATAQPRVAPGVAGAPRYPALVPSPFDDTVVQQMRKPKKKAKVKAAPKAKWDNWPTIRGHFLKYGADKDSIAWLEVAEKAKLKFPPDTGHGSKTGGQDYFAEHVLGVLRDYIVWEKEYLTMIDSNPKADRLTYWKKKYDIA